MTRLNLIPPGVFCLNIVVLGDSFERVIGHPELVALKKIRCPFERQDHRLEELGGWGAELGGVIAELETMRGLSWLDRKTVSQSCLSRTLSWWV